MKAVLVGLPLSQLGWGIVAGATNPPVPLAAGSIAAYAAADPRLRGRVDVETLRHVVGALDDPDDGDERLLRRILAAKPDVVGFSCYLWNFERVVHVSGMLRGLDEALRIVWGGPEVGFAAAETCRRHPEVDVVAAGEGEETFAELLGTWLDGGRMEEVRGIAYRDGADVRETPARPPMADLDRIPSPYRTGMLDPKAGPEGNRMLLETYRGCRYRCGFCVSPGRIRKFSLDRLRREIELAYELDLDSFAFADPLLNADDARLAALAEIVTSIEARPRKFVGSVVMVEPLTPLAVASLKRLGVRTVDAGLQSTNPAVLRVIGRRFDPARFRSGLRLLREAGISVNLQLIAGLPGDTLDGLRRTLDDAAALEPARISCFSALLLGGSGLARRKRDLGIVEDPRPPHRILRHATLGYDALRDCLECGMAFSRAYNHTEGEPRERRREAAASASAEALAPSRTVREINTMLPG